MSNTENITLNKESLKVLKNALKEFSKYLLNSSDDFSFEEIIIADTPNGIVVQLLGIDIEGKDHNLQIINISPNSITYTAPKGNKYTRLWKEVGLRGDAAVFYPYFQNILNSLGLFDIPIDRITFDTYEAYWGNLNQVLISKSKGNGGVLLHLLDKNKED